MYNLRRFFVLASLVALVVSLIGGLVIYVVRSSSDAGDYALRAAVIVLGLFVVGLLCGLVGQSLPRRIVLELDLTTLPPEAHGEGPMAALEGLGGSKSPTLREVVETIDRAARDDRVRVLLAYIGFDAAGLGTIQELRDAVLRFRAAGDGGGTPRRAIAFADTYGELGGGNGAYYLASAFDEVILQPGGEVGLVGLYRDVNFAKRALDKAGVDVYVEGRYEYKTAANQLVETGFTPPHREALAGVMESQWDQIVQGVASARGLTVEAVQAAADAGPLSAGDAVAAGLVDAAAYRDDAVERAKAAAGDGAELRWLPRYRRFAMRGSGRGRPTVAVITGVGAISRSKVPFNPLSPSSSIAGDRVASVIRKASADKRVKAIVLRINSPGGSAVGSETMWREVVRAVEAGTPVVASMSDVAGSGGYYMAAGASRIVAHPGTVTGSIGVIAQKPVLARAKDKLGIDVESLSTGRHAGLQSFNHEFDASEAAVFSSWLDRIYDDFTSKVAAGRGMTRDAVHEVARGRIWSGADAHERGLVDELGGFDVALRNARELAGLPADEPLRVIDYPKTSKLGALRSSAGRNSEDPKGVAVLAGVRSALAPAAPFLRALGLVPHHDVLHCGLDESDWLIR